MRQLFRRAWHVLRRNQFERDLASELEFHREMALRELGSTRIVGSMALAADQARDVWTWSWLQDASQDARFAVRTLLKDSRFSVAIVTALALAIGANTAAFTFLRSVYQEPPYENASQLVVIRSVDPRQRNMTPDQRTMNVSAIGVSYQDFADWKRSAKSFSNLVISSEQPMNIADEGLAPERYFGSYTSANVFRMLGHTPVLGRDFTSQDDQPGAPSVVMLGHTVWKSRYGADPKIVGRTIRVNDVPSTVIGVMPEGVHFPFVNEVWQPLSANPNLLSSRREVRTPIVIAFGRLADGVTVEQAQSELDELTRGLAVQFPATNVGIGVSLEPLKDFLTGSILQQMATILMGAVVLVLLIACVNVANLLLSRTAKRRREIAIRASLGATRFRIIRQLMIESTLLAVLSGILGFMISQGAIRCFVAAFLPQLQGAPPPYWLRLTVDAPVYLFIAVVCAATTLLFGLAPALRVSKATRSVTLNDGGRGTVSSRSHRWSGALVVAQLSLTLVLLAGTAIMARQFVTLYRASQVIDTSGVATMRMALPVAKYRTPEQRKQFFEQLEHALTLNPSISRATVASDIPFMTNTGARRELTIDGLPRPENTPPPTVAYAYVGPRYFDTLGIRILRGRALTENDGRRGAEGVVINERLASMFFRNQDPLGKRIRLVNANAAQIEVPWFTIVGVSQTIPWALFQETPDPMAYVPVMAELAPHRFASIIARGRGDVGDTIKQMREELRRVDPDLPAYFVQTLDQVLASSRFAQKLFGAIFLLLGSIALVLSTLGLFALTANRVIERTQEIGLRLALGAAPVQLIWFFIRAAVVLLAIGLAIGVGGSVVFAKYLPVLFGTARDLDVWTLGPISGVLVLVGLLASLLPARRAANVNPLVALRYD